MSEGNAVGSEARSDLRREKSGTSASAAPAPDRDEVAAEIVASRGGLGLPFELLLESPELARRAAGVGEYLRFQGVLPAALRELAILVVAHESHCLFEWQQHAPIAVRSGTSPGAIDAVATGTAPSGVDDVSWDELAVIDATRRLARDHRLPPALRDQLRRTYGERGFVEFAATVGYYELLASVMNAYEERDGKADTWTTNEGGST